MNVLTRSFLILILFFQGGLLAGEEKPEGYIRFLSLVNQGEGKTFFLVNGENIYPKGYKVGLPSGGVSYKTGKYSVEVKKEGCDSGEVEVEVKTGQTQTVIAYNVPKRGEAGGIVGWEIKFSVLKSKALEAGSQVSLISYTDLSEVKLRFGINREVPKPVVLYPRQAQVFPVPKGVAGLSLYRGKKRFFSFTAGESGPYVIILYKTEDQKVKAMYYYDSPY